MTLIEIGAEQLPEATADLATIRAACVAGDGQDPLDEAAVLALKHEGAAAGRLWLAYDTAGRATGFALLRGAALDLAVAPEDRGTGTGSALALAATPAHGPLEAWSHGDHPAAGVLAARHGLHRDRELWVMRLQLDGPDQVTVPDRDDVVVRSYRPDDRDDVLRINAAAFAEHPEQGAMDSANLAQRMAEPWYDPAGLLLAVDADDPQRRLGFHWTKRHSSTLGEVYVVGIAPEAQGRGLGRLLTAAGVRHLAEEGAREVLLYVESDNDPAVALYSGLGFTHSAVDTHVMYRR